MAAWIWSWTAALLPARGATTVDITDPEWRLIKTGAIEEKEIADCLMPA